MIINDHNYHKLSISFYRSYVLKGVATKTVCKILERDLKQCKREIYSLLNITPSLCTLFHSKYISGGKHSVARGASL